MPAYGGPCHHLGAAQPPQPDGQTWDLVTAAADAGALGGAVTVEVEAERDSLTSWKKHSITLQRAGWGLRYGQYYGGV